MKDGLLRRCIKRVAVVRYYIDLSATRLILRFKGEPGYELRGHCNGCGCCCDTPMIPAFAPVFYLKSLRWLFLTWHRVVNGFELLKELRTERIFVFRCTHLDPDTRQCDSYSSRPGMCRDYPRVLLYGPNPKFLPQCTYYPVAVNADLIRESLRDLDLPPEKIAELEEKFNAGDSDQTGGGQ